MIQFLDPDAKPLAGCYLYTFQAGTTTPQNTYKNSAGTSVNTNPVRCDAGGFVNLWLTNGLSYKFVLQDRNGVTQYTQDNITAQGLQDGTSIDLTKVLFNPNFGGTIAIQLQQWLTAQYIDMQNFSGFSTTNPDNSSQFQAAIAVAGIGSVPCLIKVPPGIYLVRSSVIINRSCIHLVGSGYGSGASPSSGTTIKANTGFNSTQTGAGFGNNFVVQLNSPGGMIDARVEQMTIDGSGLADSLYVGNANQQSGYSFITAQNFIHQGGGLYVCGAGNTGNATATCGATANGAQFDGPYSDLQLVTGTNATSSSVPLFILNAASPKEYARIHIIEPGTASLIGGYISGNNINIHDVHIEGPNTGLQVGGSTSTVNSTTGSMTLGSATLTDASAGTFTAGDVGSPITVTGAGSGGSTLSTTISAFTDATTVTLATTAITAVTNAAYSYQAPANGCPTYLACLGAEEVIASNVDMPVAGATNSHAVELYSCKDCNLTNISDTASGGFAVQTDFGSVAVSNSQNLSWLSTRWNGSVYQVWSSDPGWNWDFMNAQVTVEHVLNVQGMANLTGGLAVSGNATVSGTFGAGGTISGPDLASANSVTAGTTITAGGAIAGSALSSTTTVTAGTNLQVTANAHVGGVVSQGATGFGGDDNDGNLIWGSSSTTSNPYTMTGTWSAVYCTGNMTNGSWPGVAVDTALVGGHWQVSLQATTAQSSGATGTYHCRLIP